MKIAFGITVNAGTPLLCREDTQKFMDLVRMAEAYGAEAIGTIDSAFISGDTFVRTTLMAMASVRARIGHDLAGYCLRRRERKIEKNGLVCPERLACRPLER